MSDQQMPTFWITGYLPNGCKISFTVPINNDAYAEAMVFSNNLLSHGFTTSEVGLSAGEKKDKVGYVLRRSVINERGETPVIDVYADHEAMTWRTVKVYLNTPEQITAFEEISGLKLDALPYYEGKDSIERGDAKLGKYVIPVKNTFYAVSKVNPKHADEQDKEKQKLIPKKLFVRWESAGGQSVDKSTGEMTDKPAQPKADTDTTWMTQKGNVLMLTSSIVGFFARHKITNVGGEDIFGALNIVTGQTASRWSELKSVTRSDAYASMILTHVNFDKVKALAMAGDDENVCKAIEYWVSKTEQIDF